MCGAVKAIIDKHLESLLEDNKKDDDAGAENLKSEIENCRQHTSATFILIFQEIMGVLAEPEFAKTPSLNAETVFKCFYDAVHKILDEQLQGAAKEINSTKRLKLIRASAVFVRQFNSLLTKPSCGPTIRSEIRARRYLSALLSGFANAEQDDSDGLPDFVYRATLNMSSLDVKHLFASPVEEGTQQRLKDLFVFAVFSAHNSLGFADNMRLLGRQEAREKLFASLVRDDHAGFISILSGCDLQIRLCVYKAVLEREFDKFAAKISLDEIWRVLSLIMVCDSNIPEVARLLKHRKVVETMEEEWPTTWASIIRTLESIDDLKRSPRLFDRMLSAILKDYKEQIFAAAGCEVFMEVLCKQKAFSCLQEVCKPKDGLLADMEDTEVYLLVKEVLDARWRTGIQFLFQQEKVQLLLKRNQDMQTLILRKFKKFLANDFDFAEFLLRDDQVKQVLFRDIPFDGDRWKFLLDMTEKASAVSGWNERGIFRLLASIKRTGFIRLPEKETLEQYLLRQISLSGASLIQKGDSEKEELKSEIEECKRQTSLCFTRVCRDIKLFLAECKPGDRYFSRSQDILVCLSNVVREILFQQMQLAAETSNGMQKLKLAIASAVLVRQFNSMLTPDVKEEAYEADVRMQLCDLLQQFGNAEQDEHAKQKKKKRRLVSFAPVSGVDRGSPPAFVHDFSLSMQSLYGEELPKDLVVGEGQLGLEEWFVSAVFSAHNPLEFAKNMELLKQPKAREELFANLAEKNRVRFISILSGCDLQMRLCVYKAVLEREFDKFAAKISLDEIWRVLSLIMVCGINIPEVEQLLKHEEVAKTMGVNWSTTWASIIDLKHAPRLFDRMLSAILKDYKEQIFAAAGCEAFMKVLCKQKALTCLQEICNQEDGLLEKMQASAVCVLVSQVLDTRWKEGIKFLLQQEKVQKLLQQDAEMQKLILNKCQGFLATRFEFAKKLLKDDQVKQMLRTELPFAGDIWKFLLNMGGKATADSAQRERKIFRLLMEIKQERVVQSPAQEILENYLLRQIPLGLSSLFDIKSREPIEDSVDDEHQELDDEESRKLIESILEEENPKEGFCDLLGIAVSKNKKFLESFVQECFKQRHWAISFKAFMFLRNEHRDIVEQVLTLDLFLFMLLKIERKFLFSIYSKETENFITNQLSRLVTDNESLTKTISILLSITDTKKYAMLMLLFCSNLMDELNKKNIKALFEYDAGKVFISNLYVCCQHTKELFWKLYAKLDPEDNYLLEIFASQGVNEYQDVVLRLLRMLVDSDSLPRDSLVAQCNVIAEVIANGPVPKKAGDAYLYDMQKLREKYNTLMNKLSVVEDIESTVSEIIPALRGENNKKKYALHCLSRRKTEPAMLEALRSKICTEDLLQIVKSVIIDHLAEGGEQGDIAHLLEYIDEDESKGKSVVIKFLLEGVQKKLYKRFNLKERLKVLVEASKRGLSIGDLYAKVAKSSSFRTGEATRLLCELYRAETDRNEETAKFYHKVLLRLSQDRVDYQKDELGDTREITPKSDECRSKPNRIMAPSYKFLGIMLFLLSRLLELFFRVAIPLWSYRNRHEVKIRHRECIVTLTKKTVDSHRDRCAPEFSAWVEEVSQIDDDEQSVATTENVRKFFNNLIRKPKGEYYLTLRQHRIMSCIVQICNSAIKPRIKKKLLRKLNAELQKELDVMINRGETEGGPSPELAPESADPSEAEQQGGSVIEVRSDIESESDDDFEESSTLSFRS
jgi:hypothetical protein